MKLVFCTQLCWKLPTNWFYDFDGDVKHSQSSQNSKFAMSLQYLKKEVKDEVDFLHADKHQSFLKVYFNTLGIKVSYKVDIIIINEQLSIIILKLLKVRSL